MSSALIVSSSEKGKNILSEIIKMSGFSKIETVSNGSEVRRVFIQNNFDIVLINAPLTDEFGHDLALNITENTSSGVILMVKSNIADDICAKVENFGVFIVEKPLNSQLLYQAIKLVSTSTKRIIKLKEENLKLKNKISEIRLIDRAKCILIQYLNMTESQAHRYIEKQAMDRRITKKEVAQNILKTYEN